MVISMSWFFFFSFLLHVVSGTTGTVEVKNIFILAGQSNMAGRGGVDHHRWNGYVPELCRPNVFINRLTADMQWYQATEPLHFDIDVHKTCGVGPGMPFANSVLNVLGRKLGGAVGLVPCAVGGTKIKQWARGSWLYENMIRRARKAKEQGGGAYKALLWYQGESDTVNLEEATSYGAHLQQLIHDVRCDLNEKALPIIIVALASGEGNYVKKVREAQLGIGLKRELKNVVTVDAWGLPLKEDDHLHLTTNSQVYLGRMLAYAYLSTHWVASSPTGAEACPT